MRYVTALLLNGLRSYSTEPLVWGGRDDCAHEWGESKQIKTGRNDGGRPQKGRGWAEYDIKQDASSGQFCSHCNAWRGDLGLEPTPGLYIAHLVEIFREVKRTLHDTGAMALNLGDSFKDKQLLGIPWRVALALQADGWYLRSAMPWVKASAMPESVRDRPTNAHEYVFLLAKSKKYYWDSEAIRQRAAYDGRKDTRMKGSIKYQTGVVPEQSAHTVHVQGQERWPNRLEDGSAGRNYRTSDLFNASLDLAIQEQRAHLAHLEHVRDNGGILLDEDGAPVALKVNTAGFKGAHFAVFPPGLVEPFVKAGTSERGCCEACKAPWVRVVERKVATPGQAQGYTRDSGARNDGERAGHWTDAQAYTTGWRPTCAHYPRVDEWRKVPPQKNDETDEAYTERIAPILALRSELLALWEPMDATPATILDPFGGAGTTAMVADRLQRDAILCELNPDYAEMSRARLVSDGGMFTQVEVE